MGKVDPLALVGGLRKGRLYSHMLHFQQLQILKWQPLLTVLMTQSTRPLRCPFKLNSLLHKMSVLPRNDASAVCPAQSWTLDSQDTPPNELSPAIHRQVQ